MFRFRTSSRSILCFSGLSAMAQGTEKTDRSSNRGYSYTQGRSAHCGNPRWRRRKTERSVPSPNRWPGKRGAENSVRFADKLKVSLRTTIPANPWYAASKSRLICAIERRGP